MQKKWTTPWKEAALKRLNLQFKGVDAASQAQRLLAALRLFAINTMEIRTGLDILHPAGRIKELRSAGHEISMHWVTVETEPGVIHRVGNYMLVRILSDAEVA